MKKYILALLFVTMTAGIIQASDGSKCYRNRRTVVHAWKMGKMVDTHLKLKRNGNFRQYRSLLGLGKMDNEYGRYERRGDTLVLFFCEKLADGSAAHTYLIDCAKGNLVSLDGEYDLDFRVTKRQRKKYGEQWAKRLCAKIK